MSQQAGRQENMICNKCQIPLTLGKVTLSYLGSKFPVELFRCAKCGLVYIPEELARGKMQQVETALEDK
ncbi:zinc finger lim-type [Lucifera butyrica]|uniref:Zinc finger lim-type n=1 Tax=Lucifera butyrica TaxID=1351585 RepID=A0A498RFC4_9FIRM|nr:CLJU_RS11820 family redox protein [Lucifera butyrica]VBB08787.1 zinc finger lim-type [Lucifera butyrica]VBB08802.1 zinc finger lim-type [Lucifera butyrica]